MDIQTNENKELKILVVASTKEKARQVVREFLKIEKEETIYFQIIEDIIIKLQIRWPENNSAVQWRVVVDFMIIYLEDNEDWNKISEYVEARAGIVFKLIIYQNKVDYNKLITDLSKFGADFMTYEMLLKGEIKDKIITSFCVFSKAFKKVFKSIDTYKKGYLDMESIEAFSKENNIELEELIEIYKLVSKPLKSTNTNPSSLNSSFATKNRSYNMKLTPKNNKVIYFLDFRNVWMTSRHNFPKFKLVINKQLYKILYEEMDLSKIILEKNCLTVFFKQLEKEIKTSAKQNENNISVFHLNLISNSYHKASDSYNGLTISGNANFGNNFIEFEKTLPNYLRFGHNLELFYCIEYKIMNNISFNEEKQKFYEILSFFKIYDLVNLNKCNLRLISDRVFIDFYNPLNKIRKNESSDIENLIKLIKENKVDIILNLTLKTNLNIENLDNLQLSEKIVDFKFSVNIEFLNIKPLLSKLKEFYSKSISEKSKFYILNMLISFLILVVENSQINLELNLQEFLDLLNDIPEFKRDKQNLYEYLNKAVIILKNLIDFKKFVQNHCKIFDHSNNIVTINICLSPFILLSVTFNFDN